MQHHDQELYNVLYSQRSLPFRGLCVSGGAESLEGDSDKNREIINELFSFTESSRNGDDAGQGKTFFVLISLKSERS